MPMDFRILGPLEAHDGRALPLGGTRQRALLALLLLRRNEVVSVDQLIDGLWGESPPATAAKAVQVYVSRLRRILDPAPPSRERGDVGPSLIQPAARLGIEEAERAGTPFVLFRDAQDAQRVLPLGADTERARIGRADGCELHIAWDERVSRTHAVIERDGDEWAVVDDGSSRNGTFLNGARVSGRRRLADRDVLRVGHAALLFRVPARAGEARTAADTHLPRIDGRLLTRAPGYLLEVAPGELDLERFETLVEEARRASADDDPAAASAALGQGLALWRGPPLADLAFEPFAQAAAARLEEGRLAALESRVEADLAVGRAPELVGELAALVAEHPYRERLRRQLVLALYRADRQAEALEAYRAARGALDELGIEPSAGLAELERAILRHGPGLDLSSPERPAAHVPPPAPVRGDARRALGRHGLSGRRRITRSLSASAASV